MSDVTQHKNETTRYDEAVVYMDELPEGISLSDVLRAGLESWGLREWNNFEVDHRDSHEK